MEDMGRLTFETTALQDVLLILPQPVYDSRGYFSRAFCQQECTEAGITCQFVQDNISYNQYAGTLRGMHFQRDPYGEDKLLRCIAGEIDDILVDLRPASPTYRKWEKYRLTASNGRALFIPKGFAHGYITLCDHTSVYYKVSQIYHPEAASGIRWDDPAIGIHWEKAPQIISGQDKAWPLLGQI